MIRFRGSSEVLKYGDFKPLLATDTLLIYSRESPQTGADNAVSGSKEAYTAAFNFSYRRIKLNREAQVFLRGNVAASNIGRVEWGSTVPMLESWEALILRTN
jgi:hypothetical protein